MSTYLYGYSDDLIELEGDIYEEISPVNDEWTDVQFSNGVEAQIIYNAEGEWSIRVTKDTLGLSSLNLVGSTLSQRYCSYSDVLVVEDAEWAVVGKKVNKRGTQA